ncbi:MAG: hypothetical protein JWQ44_2336 [Chthoniobacter sp.]|nr:hypothetical protein [Chthoniobacter sp.]
MKLVLTLSAALFLVACTTPQGKRLKENPVALASPEPMKSVVLTEGMPQEERSVWLKSKGTVTVMLGAQTNSPYSWRLGEIPDPAVLKLVSKSRVGPAQDSQTAAGARVVAASQQGLEKWVFEAVGPGTVPVRLWYAQPAWESLTDAHRYTFTVSVD